MHGPNLKLALVLSILAACGTPAADVDGAATVTTDGGVTMPSTSSIGTNLTGISDWSAEWTFVDAFKASRDWISGSATQWDDGRALDLDADGWVRSLQPRATTRCATRT